LIRLDQEWDIERTLEALSKPCEVTSAVRPAGDGSQKSEQDNRSTPPERELVFIFGVQPALGSEFFECLIVGVVGMLSLRQGMIQHVVEMVDEHHSNGMDRIMPIQAFGLKPFKGSANGNLVAERDLVFHHRVNSPMGVNIREFDPRLTVVPDRQLDPFRLVQRKPLLRVGRLKRGRSVSRFGSVSKDWEQTEGQELASSARSSSTCSFVILCFS
jgi:hypothetical protein